MTVVRYIAKTLQWTCIVSLVIAFSQANVLAGVPELLAQGDNARMMGDYSSAEKFYTEPLEAELVDETVVAPHFGKTNMQNYLEPSAKEKVPQLPSVFFEVGQDEAH